jgi:hypothetical protein
MQVPVVRARDRDRFGHPVDSRTAARNDLAWRPPRPEQHGARRALRAEPDGMDSASARW